MKKYYLIVFCLCILAASPLYAACDGSSPTWSCSSWTDLKSLVEGVSVQSGDTITLVANTYTPNSTITLPAAKSIRITGEGDTTLISGGTANPVFQMNIQDGTFHRIDNMKFYQTNRGIRIYGYGTDAYRIDNNTFDNLTSHNIDIRGGGVAYGVIDNNTFHMTTTGTNCIATREIGPGVDAGTSGWAEELGLGTKNAIYVEDNDFIADNWQAGTSSFHDGNCGTRIVIRHNTIQNIVFGMHDACPNYRLGAAMYEIYQNEFLIEAGYSVGINFTRGGTGVIWGNTARNSVTWDGQNPYRYNAPFYRGSSSGCQDLWATSCDSTNEYMCSDGAGGIYPVQCTTDADCASYGGHCDTIVDEPGVGYPCRNQTGTKKGREAHPVVGWDNYYCSGSAECNATSEGSISSTNSFVQNGRDIVDPIICESPTDICTAYLDSGRTVDYGAGDVTIMAIDYTPYEYPHPLRDESSGGATNTGTFMTGVSNVVTTP
jgi:hypothetical protein